ncbi:MULTISPECIES: hypothetical protein [Acinetobacter]|jgi:hypothetical protein|uniref:hypothetical protein n=1 Tax=Acinetobacter TaxID=469 RepID=UPI0004D5F6AB|nr:MULTISPECIES: hypothetical protein [unclassified Acinetobacter]KEC83204.1 signal peptide protein [Acinetobacter sp. ETR1]WEE41202.1 hypothetical protein PYV58_08580 [Acinetobacter sp. TAC-1]
MNKIINTALLLSAYSSLSFANQPSTSLQKFVPNNWEILAQAEGDLNQDGKKDIALIIQPKNENQHNRKLLVLFQKGQQLQLKLSRQIPNWTYRSEELCIEDALDDSSLTIKNQRLDVLFNTMSSCSNTYGLIYTYGFKLKNNQFHLIGFDVYDLDKISGKLKETSLNFLSNKAKVTTTPNIFAQVETPSKIVWKTLRTSTGYTLENIPWDSEELIHNFSVQFIGEK